jgi:phosphate-selective porin OprO and OprP
VKRDADSSTFPPGSLVELRKPNRRGTREKGRRAGLCLCLLTILTRGAPSIAWGQTPQPGTTPAVDPSGTDDSIEAGEADAETPRRQLVRWNEYEGPFFTIRMGGGLLYDYAAFSQDEASRQQVQLASESKLRDGRLLLKGRLKFKRQVTWSSGLMYDGATDSWLVRETGIMVEVPEIWGHLFVGRTKEGFSLNKVMVGYAGWTMERATISDATIPILADGVKWLGLAPKLRLLWNVGVYGDWLSEGQSFSTYDHQVVGRLAWLPAFKDRTRLHVGMSLRYGWPDDGVLRLRSRPEIFIAPYFIDTDKFAADNTRMIGVEAYYRPGPLLIGSEYFVQKVKAPESGNPIVHGGDAVVSWLVTGETRAYNTRGGFFNQVSPARTVLEGGPGAWELVGRVSYSDLDGGDIRGGRFWRITPMMNWYLSDQLRLEFAYGYGMLDRFNLRGATHFFQTRLQMQL